MKYQIKQLYNFSFLVFALILSQENICQSISYHTHYFNNSFSGGQIILNNQQVDVPQDHSLLPDNITYYATAINNQYYQSYTRVFNCWNLNGEYRTNNITISYTYNTGATGGRYNIYHDAIFKRLCNLTFQANSGIYINNYLRSSPCTEYVLEDGSINASADGYYSNGLDYSFINWTSGGQSFSSPITASEHKTYTADYLGKPSNSGKYASCSGSTGNPIVVTWTDNVNTAVNQYEIWRKVKHNNVWGSPILLTTVGRGVQIYTDYDYVWTEGYTDDLLQYDVKEYYSTEGTYSDPDWVTAYGRENANIHAQNGQLLANAKEIPDEYSISNYPNPFNPTTTINYQLPQDGLVTIKVYDMLGKEVAVLVNENKSTGNYKIDFNANKLTSGVYVYTITANNFIQSKKMILMK